MNVRILSRADVARLADIDCAFDAARTAYLAYGEGSVEQPDIVSIQIPRSNGEMDIKSGCDNANRHIGVKLVTGFWDNPRRFNAPATGGLMLLLDSENGFPLAIMDAGGLTHLRTAAAGAYAATLLARPDSRVIALMGAGELAKRQLLATARRFSFERAYIFDADFNRSSALAEEMKRTLRFDIEACPTAADAARDADIIVTATNARAPILMAGDVKAGAHINAFGCDMPEKQELDTALFRGALAVVDCMKECVRRGETAHPIHEGVITENDIYCELSDIACGRRPGRSSAEQLTVFDSVGMSVQDIALASNIYSRAEAENVGTVLEM